MSIRNLVDHRINELLSGPLRWLRQPMVMYAVVSGASQVSEGQYRYCLKLLGNDLQPDTAYPEIPGVWSDVELQVGELAAVLLVYGTPSSLHIVGKAVVG